MHPRVISGRMGVDSALVDADVQYIRVDGEGRQDTVISSTYEGHVPQYKVGRLPLTVHVRHTPKVLAHDEDVRVAAVRRYDRILVDGLPGLVRMPSILQVEPEVGLQAIACDERRRRFEERLRALRIAGVAAGAVV